ncbi:MAG TPA: hypothetical protein VEV17_09525 [Bryobacteraceae bacterium]|nr:hypothetical protein [Bryobacteraceae bacterium]
MVAFLACFWAGRRSVGLGLVVLFAFGYFYGILRANLLTSFSHFIFDAGMIGLFLAVFTAPRDPDRPKDSQWLRAWTFVLIAWPALLILLPVQPLLVSLVGLRSNIFFLPLLLLGSRLRSRDLIQLSIGLALLDLIAVGFAGAEYFLGVPRFYPLSPVTEIIYNSGDVEGGFLRIPATFTSAHAFGGTMVGTMPYLIGLWMRAEKSVYRLLALVTMPIALLGVLMSATRQNFVLGSAMVLFAFSAAKLKMKHRLIFVLVVAIVGYFALTNTRFQRFKSLSDTDTVAERIAGSVNRSFWEVLTEYPMGNGLGGAGSSMPYFLQSEVKNAITIENQYALILGEQGIVGLAIWIAFLLWFFSRAPVAFAKGPWANTRRLAWGLTAFGFGTAWIGTGLLTSIPGTLLLMLGVGWTSVAPAAERVEAVDRWDLPLGRPPRAHAVARIAEPITRKPGLAGAQDFD